MFKFEISLTDLIAFNRHYFKTHQTIFQKFVRPLLFGGLVLYVFFGHGEGINAFLNWGNWVILLLIIAMTSVPLLLVDFTRVRTIRKLVKQNPKLIGERSILFDEEKATVQMENVSTEYKYEAFVKFEETKEYYYAYVNQQNAVIIPKGKSDETEVQKLINNIRNNVEKLGLTSK